MNVDFLTELQELACPDVSNAHIPEDATPEAIKHCVHSALRQHADILALNYAHELFKLEGFDVTGVERRWTSAQDLESIQRLMAYGLRRDRVPRDMPIQPPFAVVVTLQYNVALQRTLEETLRRMAQRYGFLFTQMQSEFQQGTSDSAFPNVLTKLEIVAQQH